jgi:hypothetical protein
MKKVTTWAILPLLISLFLGFAIGKYWDKVSAESLSAGIFGVYLLTVLGIRHRQLGNHQALHVGVWLIFISTLATAGYFLTETGTWSAVGGALLGFFVFAVAFWLKSKSGTATQHSPTSKGNAEQGDSSETMFDMETTVTDTKSGESRQVKVSDMFGQSVARSLADMGFAEAQKLNAQAEVAQTQNERIEKLIKAANRRIITEEECNRQIRTILLNLEPEETNEETRGSSPRGDKYDPIEEQITVVET